MCKWGTTTPVMVLRPADLSCTGYAVAQSVPVDSCIAGIVEALASSGIGTRGSCCGHYNRDGLGKIELDDGRSLLVVGAMGNNAILARGPEVVVLCGSTRFKDDFESENRRLTLAGRIVISVGLFGHIEGLDIGTDGNPSAVKVMLDELHKRKIDLSDSIHVINVGGYIGTSTRSEINYALRMGKRVTYMEPMCDATPCRGRGSDEDCAECAAWVARTPEEADDE